MSGAKTSAKRRCGSGALPALCNLLGTLILLAVILTYLPLSAPRLIGVEAYHVESGSMAPELPQGSAAFVRAAEATEIAPGDVIAFRTEDAVVLHRVVQNRVVEGEFVTKGDANPAEDPTPVPYSALCGRLVWHVPVLGGLLALYATPVGKLYALLLAGSGVLFHLLAGRLRARRSAVLREDLAAELTASAETEDAAQKPAQTRRAPRRKKGKTVLVIVLLLAFAGSVVAVLLLTGRYRAGQHLYESAAADYVSAVPTQEQAPPETVPATGETVESVPVETAEPAPITVDFAALQAQNPDVVGWIYCEGTPINYPLLQGETNDSYLRTGFDGKYCYAGSIFLAADNSPDFSDDNTIIYGHNLKDGTMFACLSDWADEGFFAAHPVLWILTPAQDYRVDLFACYLTDAYADAYQTKLPTQQDRAQYIAKALAKSDVRQSAAPRQDANYILLSTCAYDFETARYVLHGVLTPAETDTEHTAP